MTLHGLSERGWMRSDAGDHPAHYFTNGYSACHTWAQTTLDRPAKPGEPHCKACSEAVHHGLV